MVALRATSPLQLKSTAMRSHQTNAEHNTMPVTTPERDFVPASTDATPTRPVPKPAAQTAVLGQIDQSLEQALMQGAGAVDQQIRFVLAHSQALGRRALTEQLVDRSDRPISPNNARLTVLVSLVEENNLGAGLNPEQIEQVVADLAQVGDEGLRLLLAAQLAAYRTPQAQAAVLREAWSRLNRFDSSDLDIGLLDKTSSENAARDNDAQDITPALRSRILHYLSLLQVSDPNEGPRSGIIMEMYRIAKSISSAEGRLRSLAALAVNVPLVSSRKIYERVLSDLVKVRNDALRSTTLSALAVRIPAEFEADIIATALAVRSPVTKARALTSLAQALPERTELTALAVETVASIVEEDERIEAFATVVPGLYHHQPTADRHEYPQALTAALTIAINFSKRALRARALVALAPYLTRDLQIEALAVVNGMPNERERAGLLAELAPHLPPVILASSLRSAHTMREQDSRAHVLTVLAHHLPEDAEMRSQTMLDALAAVTNLPNAFERVRGLVALGDILPDHMQNQAFTNAVESARLIENENARARALSLLAAHVSPMLLRRVLEAVYELRDAQQRLNALAVIVARIPPEERDSVLTHMLETGMKLPFAYQRARAVISVAPNLTAAHLDGAFAIANSIHEAHDRASALIALAHVQPPHSRSDTIAEAWTQVGKIEDGYDRASALVAIAPLLPAALRPELEARIGMVVGSIMDDYDQASALCLLAPLLTDTIPPREITPLPSADLLLAQAVFTALRISSQTERARCLAEIAPTWALQDESRRFSLWREATQQLKSLPLADVLLCLSVLMPVVRAIAGDDQLLKVAQVLGIQHRKSDEP